jgi:PUB domain
LTGPSVVSPEISAGNITASASTEATSSHNKVEMEVCDQADFRHTAGNTGAPLSVAKGAATDEVIPHFPAQIMAHVTAVAKNSLSAIADTRSDEKIGSNRDPSVSNDKKIINSERQSSATSSHIPDKQSEKKSRSEAPLNRSDCVDVLLSENFDRVSSPCVLTIVKYIQNIISDPSDPKYRTINTGNKTFQDKVLLANSALNLMYSIGFKEVPGSPSLRTAATVDELSASLTLLEGAMDRLMIPVSDRPKPRQAAIQASQSQVPLPEWDPYQSSIVRTAPQVQSFIFTTLTCYSPDLQHRFQK